MSLAHSPSAHTQPVAETPVLASDETWPDTALAKTIYAHFADFEGVAPDEAADSTGALLYSLQKVGIVGAPPEPVAWMDRDQDWDVISAIKKADYESVSQHYVWSMERYCRPLYLREEIGVVGSMPEGAMVMVPQIDYEVWQNGGMVASASNISDAQHYMAIYGQDGPVEAKTSFSYLVDGFTAIPPLAAIQQSPISGEGWQDEMMEAGAGLLKAYRVLIDRIADDEFDMAAEHPASWASKMEAVIAKYAPPVPSVSGGAK